MLPTRSIKTHTLGAAGGLLLTAVLLAASVGSAATPVASSISAETFARICSDGSCSVVLVEETPIDVDAQLSSLNPLSVLASADVTSSIGANADALMSINASFSSASSGSLAFFGDLGIRKPAVSSTHACQATNNQSEGFEYTFVSSADGMLTFDYTLECTPTGGANFCGGQLEFYLDDVRLPDSPDVTTADPLSVGTATRPITIGTTHTIRIQPVLGNVGGGTGCFTPAGFSWNLTGDAAWSFDAAPGNIVAHTFSGRAVADPLLTTGQVPAEVQTFLDAQNLNGAWFAASFSFDDSNLDSDPAPNIGEYLNAIIDSDLSFGPLQHEATEFCDTAILDCSILANNDLPYSGGLSDQFTLRARNHSVLGVPQVLDPVTQTMVDAFDVSANFQMQAYEPGPAATLLADASIDPDIEAIFAPGTHDIVITYSGTGTAGAYSVGYRVQTPYFVPEPHGSIWVMMAFFTAVLHCHGRSPRVRA